MENIQDYAKRMMQEISEIIAKNTDNRIKSVGDRVIVWDFSGFTDKETGKRIGFYELGKTKDDEIKGIFIQTDCKKIYQLFFGPQITLDLLLVINNKEYYTSSNFVKRIDTDKI